MRPRRLNVLARYLLVLCPLYVKGCEGTSPAVDSCSSQRLGGSAAQGRNHPSSGAVRPLLPLFRSLSARLSQVDLPRPYTPLGVPLAIAVFVRIYLHSSYRPSRPKLLRCCTRQTIGLSWHCFLASSQPRWICLSYHCFLPSSQLWWMLQTTFLPIVRPKWRL
jgi:hypothetical protein